MKQLDRLIAQGWHKPARRFVAQGLMGGKIMDIAQGKTGQGMAADLREFNELAEYLGLPPMNLEGDDEC